MKNFRLYNRTITDIEKGVFYYEIINGEKDSNNEFIVYKTPIEIEDISENSNWEAELLKEKNLGQLTQFRIRLLYPITIRIHLTQSPLLNTICLWKPMRSL